MAPYEDDPRPKRNRTLLLCDQCRKRKVKCDRKMPCQACVRFRRPNECDYSGDIVFATPNSDFQGKISVFRMISGANPTIPLKAENQPYKYPDSLEEVVRANSSGQLWHGSFKQPLDTSLASPYGLYNGQPEITSVSPGSAVYLELEALKKKVSQLEANLHKKRGDSTLVMPLNPQLPPLDVLDNVFQPPIKKSPQLNPVSENSTYSGINPHDVNQPEELLDLYHGYNPIQWGQNRQMNYGPYSWFTIMKKDPSLVRLSEYVRVQNQNHFKSTLPLVPKDATTSKEVALKSEDDHEEEFRKKTLARDGHSDLAPFSDQLSSINEMKIKMNQNSLALGLTFFEGELGQKTHLLEKIRLVLPTKMSIWILINRFFDCIYPFVPLIDEIWFRSEIKRLLGPEFYKEEKYEAIKVEKRLDFATLGILLIVLRLSYLSTFSNNKAENDRALSSPNDSPLAETKYILTHPIDIDVINLAQICLDQFDLYRGTNITVLQAAVFMRIYHLFSPEEGDGSDGGDSHVFNNMCLQIAYSMGLHREPNKYEGLVSDEKNNNIGRKLWFFLKWLDMNQSFQYGFPLSVDDEYNDVLVPYYRPGNSNVLDANMEKSICEVLNAAEDLNQDFRRILKHSLSLRHKMTMADLTELLSKFEHKLDSKFGSLSKFTDGTINANDYLFRKVFFCKAYMNAKSFLITMHFHFFLNFEKTGRQELAFFYLRKYLAVACGEFLTEYLLLIENNHANFDPKSTTPDLILSPSIESLLHKTNQMNFSILVRINYAISSLKQNLEVHSRNLLISFDYKLRYARLCKLSKLLEKFCKFGTSCLSRLSGRYYYAWRVSKAHNHIVELINKDKFLEFLSRSDPKFLSLTNEQLNELLLIADSTLWKIKSLFKPDTQEANSTGIALVPETPSGQTYQDVNAYGPNKRNQVEPFDQVEDRPFKQASTETPNLLEGQNEKLQSQTELNKHWMPEISSSRTQSFDLEDFFMEDNEEIDLIWRQLTNINNRMVAELQQEIPGALDAGSSKDGWIPLYLKNVPLQPFALQNSGLDNIDGVYDFF